MKESSSGEKLEYKQGASGYVSMQQNPLEYEFEHLKEHPERPKCERGRDRVEILKGW